MIVLVTLASPAPAQERLTVPSGQPVTLQDVIMNQPGPAGLTARFRFIAPQIASDGGSIDFDTASLDMDHLCNSYALPRIKTVTGPMPQQIIISLSDIPVLFGEITPQATQFFEAYTVSEDGCVWEQF